MRRFWVSIVVVLLGLAAAPRAGAATAMLPMRNLGPAVSGGRVAAVAGSDADPALYYVGAADGGAWKTTDGGTRWKPVFDAQDVQSIGAIAIDPRNPHVVWVGTGEANPRNDVTQGDGVYLTRDGGRHWSHVLWLPDSLIAGITIDPRQPDRVLVGVLGDPFADSRARGVYRTTDGGAHWTQTLYLAPDSGVSDMARDPADPNVVYAGMWQFRRTGWSSNSGGPNDGLFRSRDGGATWTRLSGGGLPSGIEGRIAVAIAPSNPKVVYALIQSKHGLLWRSTDGGATWHDVSHDTLIDERPFYFSHIFVDPVDPRHLWSVSVHLAQSTDGGRHWHTTGHGLHGDHHAMWIGRGGRRIIEGNDGGVGFSADGGKSWRWDNHLPIAQLYHVGYSYGTHFDVCAPLQDNGTWCAPANPLDPRGISASRWITTGAGGDGTWVVVDPTDAARVWQSFGGGNNGGDVWIHDYTTGDTRSVAPYLRDQNVFPPYRMRYRFNWETPIAFDPFDPQRVYVGANVLLATTDRGYRWHAVSGDLTRNDPAHQQLSGGITLDATGAETADTILEIAPSQAARGEIWVGTDDGYVQLTRDGGRHWRNVTPPGIAPWGRFGSISPAIRDPATAYAAYDRHMVGDRRPYLFVTHDFGLHWQSLAAGLPRDDDVRSVLVDPHDSRLLFAGLARGLYASWDGGAHWRRLDAVPATAVDQVALQPATDDLLVATHGRGLYVLDDAAPLEQRARARAAGTYLFAVPPATAWEENSYWNTANDGAGPPYGALVSYYLTQPAKSVRATILDARGSVVRRYAQAGAGAQGYNRFNWDLTTDGARPWHDAAKWNRGFPGVPVPPGRYTLRLQVGAQTLTRAIEVRPDPRLAYTPAEYAQNYALQKHLLALLSQVDGTLDTLDAVERTAPQRAQALRRAGHPQLAARLAQAADGARALIARLSSDPANDQDDDFLPDLLRERIEALLGTFASYAPPTAAQARAAAALDRLAARRLGAYRSFTAGLAPLDARLRAAGEEPLLGRSR